MVNTTDEQILAANVAEPRLLDGPIRLVDYDPQWPLMFDHEARRIRDILGENVVAVEHVGSTSVTGLAAKPVVDIVLLVADSSLEQAYVPKLERYGYKLRIREPDWFEHRLLDVPNIDANLHVFCDGCEEVDRMLLFRDWLRSNVEDRMLYQRTKRQLAAKRWKYGQHYADAKSDVISEIMNRASCR
jgi:GrpB-like predicted nucleotidyltransferase (UPF0157 family)